MAFRPHIEGLDTFPADGAVILAANHLSFCDSVFLPLLVPRPVHLLGKAEYMTARGIRGWAMRRFFTAVGTIPIDRTSGPSAVVALDAGRRALEAGKVFALYPEGTRSPDGRLYRGHTGVARLAMTTEAPVVPCALAGTDRVQPPGRLLPHPRRVVIRFGEPLLAHPAGLRDVRAMRAFTHTVMARIGELSRQEYVDRYAVRSRAA
jgi:1-acyl-sn-glycerol-3-phosphate acyltransferase